MKTRKAEFFIVVENFFNDGIRVRKTSGVVFDYKGRLCGLDLWSDGSNSIWGPIDIKTGMYIGKTSRNPLDDKNEELMDELIERFDEFDLEKQKRCAKIIKAAYDANPDMKRQVFGE